MGTVNGDNARTEHSWAEERDSKKLLFGYPSKIVREKSLKTEDIKLTDMVADKDVCLIWDKVLRSFYPYIYTGKMTNDSAPIFWEYLDLLLRTSNEIDVNQGQYAEKQGVRDGKDKGQYCPEILDRGHGKVI